MWVERHELEAANGSDDSHLQEGAFADVVVKLGLIKLIQKRFDVCEEL